MKQNPFEKVTDAVLHPSHNSGRTRELLEPTQGKNKRLIQETDRLLWELEELNLKEIKTMPAKLRVRLLQVLLECDILPVNVPFRTKTGLEWTYRAQAELFGLGLDEEYILEE